MGYADPIAQSKLAHRTGSGLALGDNLFLGITFACAITLNILLLLLVGILGNAGYPAFQTFGIQFLWSTAWQPNPAIGQLQFGALPFIYGTLVTSAIALIIGVPVSLGIAIFLSELAPSWVANPLSFLVELLAAVPSVVYGLWGFIVLKPFMGGTIEPAIQSVLGFLPIFKGPTTGYDLFTAGVILAIMIIPTISSISRDTLRSVPQNQREAALSLGATQWETTRVAVVSYSRVGIFGAVILGLGRAVGETMAVTMTIGNSNRISTSLFGPGQSIASLIANNFGEASTEPVFLSSLLLLALILLLMSLLINVVARLVFRRYTGATEGSR